MNNVRCKIVGDGMDYFFKKGGVYATSGHPEFEIGDLLIIDPYREKWARMIWRMEP
ncbi:hypothetical protein phiTE_073 [Pectobacterium phage phiTE]|uniref:Uncharacterized protein n=1 Tax=Pectobacterium phage phiTE TaxID=1116482 RepID=K9L3R2_9CAUD|nr:hypothetical protein phiTE_073 [Pectobacterium phage phiTE]AEZ66239.1 hypothetical protein phiTE_073 [Pectobacterium phage phiTE]